MIQSMGNPHAGVLHVYSAPSPQTQRVEQLLDRESLDSISAPDVYRALARLARDPHQAQIAVLVCVDQLGPAEMEFFKIAARVCPDRSVYAYGDDRYTDRLRKATDLGASGSATYDTIEQLIRKLTNCADDVTPTTTTPARGSSEKAKAPPPAPAPIAAAHESDDVATNAGAVSAEHHAEEEKETPEREDAPEGVVRVPWLRYGQRPLRQSPQPGAAEGRSEGTCSDRAVRSQAHQPLLTEEELQALIGEDVGPASAPREDPPETGSDQQEGKAT